MKNKLFSTLILFLYVTISLAQSDLNAYKYIIVPKKFDFLKKEDQYRLNSLTKFLFEKQAYQVYFEDENYPADLMNNPCLALDAQVKNNSSMFTSKLVVELSNCYNKVVYTSATGKSKIKDYKESYHEALREAFVSFEAMPYNFNEALVVNATTPKANVAPAVVTPAVVTAVVEETPVVEKQTEPLADNEKSLAKSYRNENISFILIEQNNNLIAYVKESRIAAYQMGEKIGVLSRTSRPDTYRITWKAKDGKSYKTTGYFDQKGDLKIDLEKEGEIQVISFEVEN